MLRKGEEQRQGVIFFIVKGKGYMNRTVKGSESTYKKRENSREKGVR